jgi:hypothetical protein
MALMEVPDIAEISSGASFESSSERFGLLVDGLSRALSAKQSHSTMQRSSVVILGLRLVSRLLAGEQTRQAHPRRHEGRRSMPPSQRTSQG